MIFRCGMLLSICSAETYGYSLLGLQRAYPFYTAISLAEAVSSIITSIRPRKICRWIWRCNIDNRGEFMFPFAKIVPIGIANYKIIPQRIKMSFYSSLALACSFLYFFTQFKNHLSIPSSSRMPLITSRLLYIYSLS